MTLYRYTYFFLITAMIAVMAACSSDDDAVSGVVTDGNSDGKVPVKIHLSVAGERNANTRAWKDTPNATDDEMMNIWTVIAVHAEDDTSAPKKFEAGDIAFIHASVPEAAKREIDDLVYLTPGRYMFYSFANMEPLYVMGLLGIPNTGNKMASVHVNGTLDTPSDYSSEKFTDNNVYSLTWGSTSTKVTSTNVASKVVQVNGNGFNPMATDNGFGVKGIPMSNLQEIEVTKTDDVDLIVVRMLAKMKISVTNATGSTQYIKYATISNVTSNTSDNLKLLPNYTNASSANTMEAVHGDIQPNLNGTPATTELTIPDMATSSSLANNATREVTFYVNECAKGTDFYLTIGLGDNTSTQEYRYALIDNKGATSADNDKWDYIARNDYRIIPVTLDDYKLELVPYDFPPIGVYPVSVREIDNVNHVYEFTFHDYGHFHLLPKVTKGGTTQVKYNVGGTSDYWTLQPASTSPDVSAWEKSFFTAATKGNAWLSIEQVKANGFYRDQTATADGDEVGGVPYWYLNDGNAGPQWDPASGTNYEPFIFGYIAEPSDEWWAASPRADRQIYHEFRVKLFVGGTYRRDLIYRFYMTLSKDQMLGSRSLTPMSRKRH